MNDSTEYKIVTGEPSDCEKTLNRWRKKYDLRVLSMCINNFGVAILVTREPHEANTERTA